MVCALVGIGIAVAAKLAFKRFGIDAELPAPVVVYAAIATASTFALWLVWLA
jgi:hypothetical protein